MRVRICNPCPDKNILPAGYGKIVQGVLDTSGFLVHVSYRSLVRVGAFEKEYYEKDKRYYLVTSAFGDYEVEAEVL